MDDTVRTAEEIVETMYGKYHRAEFIFPDPLAVVRTYREPADIEIAGLVCSAIALGRVSSIVNTASGIMSHFPQPSKDILSMTMSDFRDIFASFVYRFFGCEEISHLFLAIRRILEEYGSLNACFAAGLEPSHDSVLPALIRFYGVLNDFAAGKLRMLLPDPAKGSASKRFHLFLRWMVRHDAIDPGPWTGVPPALLIYPMDTHMLQVSRLLGFTRRRQADLKTALEVTAAFRTICPEDPVRYDFSLTRPGIHPELSLARALAEAVRNTRNDGDA